MAVIKTIEIDGKAVTFKASAAVPRLYRIKFGKDLYRDFADLQKNIDKEGNTLDIRSLEVFEQISWVMAKHGDPENVPDDIDDWLERRMRLYRPDVW